MIRSDKQLTVMAKAPSLSTLLTDHFVAFYIKLKQNRIISEHIFSRSTNTSQPVPKTEWKTTKLDEYQSGFTNGRKQRAQFSDVRHIKNLQTI